MSRFFNARFSSLEPYVPGEQPQDQRYVKLNTNESPYPPTPHVVEAIRDAGAAANLYCDPACRTLRQKAAALFGVEPENISAFNGSDEALSLAFQAFGQDGVSFPAVSYGFYPVFAQQGGIDALEMPLKQDLTIDPTAYHNAGRLVVIANPNAPTGLALTPEELAAIAAHNPNHVVVVDEAYVAFGAQSVIPLTRQFENLLVTWTFSKSHALAGARLGFAIGNPVLIADLDTLRYSINPYNVTAMSQAAGCAAIDDNDVYTAHCLEVTRTRAAAAAALRELGFLVTDSKANFLFVRHPRLGGQTLYLALKARGVLVRWFSKPGLEDYLRITVGTAEQMDRLVQETREVLYENR